MVDRELGNKVKDCKKLKPYRLLWNALAFSEERSCTCRPSTADHLPSLQRSLHGHIWRDAELFFLSEDYPLYPCLYFRHSLVRSLHLDEFLNWEKCRNLFMVNVALCKRIRISEFGKFLLVDSGIQGFGVRNIAQGIRNSFNDWTSPESKVHWQRLESSSWNPESMACNPESKTVLDSLTWTYTASLPGSLSRSVGTGRREPWERGWSLQTLGATIRFTCLIEKVYNSLLMFFSPCDIN